MIDAIGKKKVFYELLNYGIFFVWVESALRTGIWDAERADDPNRKRFEDVIMKKGKIRLVAALGAAAVLLTACGSKEYLKDIKAEKYVTLGTYTGIEVEEKEPAVADGVVDSYINYILAQKATTKEVTGRAVQEGDVVSIDYAGYQDGVAFDGGTGSYDLTIGSGSFIDGFEDGLIGHEVGEKISLDLTFPDPYQNNPDLAGKPVVFEVTINAISESETPELNDEFVAGLAIENVSTVDEFRDYVYNIFYQDAQSTYDNTVKADITDKIMAGCTFEKLPDEMIDRYYNGLVDEMTALAKNQNMTLVDYLNRYYGLDATTYEDKLKEIALTRGQQYVMMQAIADKEGIQITDEDVDQEIQRRVEAYGYASADEYKKSTDVEALKEYLLANKVMDFLIENANITTVPADDGTTQE